MFACLWDVCMFVGGWSWVACLWEVVFVGCLRDCGMFAYLWDVYHGLSVCGMFACLWDVLRWSSPAW